MASAVWLFLCLGFRMWMVAPNVEGQGMGSPRPCRNAEERCRGKRVLVNFYTANIPYYPSACAEANITLPDRQPQMKYKAISLNSIEEDHQAHKIQSLQYIFKKQCTLPLLGLEAPKFTAHFVSLDLLNEMTNEVDVPAHRAPLRKPNEEEEEKKKKLKGGMQSVELRLYGLGDDFVNKVHDSVCNGGKFSLDCVNYDDDDDDDDDDNEDGDDDGDDEDSMEEWGETERTVGPLSTRSVPQTPQSTGDPGSILSFTHRSTEDSASTTVGTTQLPTSSSSQDPGDHSEDNNSTLLYTIGISSVLIVIVGVALFLYCLRKRRSEEENSLQPTQLSTVPAWSQYDEIILDSDDRDDSSPREQTQTGTGSDEGQLTQTGTGSDEGQLTQTGTGSDDGQLTQTRTGSNDGEYVHLVRDERQENGAVSRHDVYDHTTSSRQRGRKNDSSEQGGEVYNHLQHHPEKQAVIDNVYDSTK